MCVYLFNPLNSLKRVILLLPLLYKTCERDASTAQSEAAH